MTPETKTPLKLLGIVGSLRSQSLNRALLNAVGELLPEGVSLSTFDRLGEIPHFDADLAAKGDPEPVVAFKQAIAEADGLLIATPEYNYSVPGVLKNAIDWASRPPPTSPLRDKPVGIIGASMGMSGTMRAQYHLRQVLVFTNSPMLLQPEVVIPKAHERFDAQGKLTDGATREHLQRFALALADWVRRMQ
jgi:chromate reductase